MSAPGAGSDSARGQAGAHGIRGHQTHPDAGGRPETPSRADAALRQPDIHQVGGTARVAFNGYESAVPMS